jgi:hypothetical protein
MLLKSFTLLFITFNKGGNYAPGFCSRFFEN